jgi:hypothetical protein
MLRCPLCAGLNHTTLRDELLRCKLCSLGFRKDGGELPSLDVYRVRDGVFQFFNWNSWSGKIMRRPAVNNRQPFYFSPPTVKMFATQQGRHATAIRSSLPIVPIFASWSYGRIIQAKIETPLAQATRGSDSRLTLGIIAARDAWQEALDLCVDMSGHVGDIIVVLDTTDVTLAAKLERDLRSTLGNRTGGMRHRVMAHPLGADFAMQRNRIQREARTEWVLQLDCDERLTVVTKVALSGIIDDAEREGWDAIALSRRNLVDGIVSALYPDVQYRLLRRAVRFTRAVHEYPQLGPSQHSFFYLGAEIIHRLASERLEQRGALYEGIQGDAGRPHDTALLRRPLEAAVSVAR